MDELLMETKQIISWLRDKACRADNPSWTRMMHTAADQLMRLEYRLAQSNAERDAVTKRMIELEMAVGDEKESTSNGDKIRSMKDEELAQFLVAIQDLDSSIPYCQNKPECERLLDEGEITQDMCTACMIQWIRQEADHE